jgi:tRNA (guanine-N7-)-methyltransferase
MDPFIGIFQLVVEICISLYIIEQIANNLYKIIDKMDQLKENNPYIEKIKDHKYINQDLSLLPEYKGRWNKYFENKNPLRLEIGTGMGNFFSSEVPKFPDRNFIGMEIKFKRCYITAEKTIAK